MPPIVIENNINCEKYAFNTPYDIQLAFVTIYLLVCMTKQSSEQIVTAGVSKAKSFMIMGRVRMRFLCSNMNQTD